MASQFQMIRFDLDLIERIDNVKNNDMIPRDPFIRQLVMERLDQLEEAARVKRRRARARKLKAR